MKTRISRWVVSLVLVLVPVHLFAFDGAQTTPAPGVAGSIGSDAVVNVTIPAVIGIDVESDVTFDFGTYAAPANANDCGANVWPPGAACAAAATMIYTPSLVTDTTAIGGTANEMWIAIFSNKTGVEASMNVGVSAGPWVPAAGPGFAASAVRLRDGTVNAAVNGATFGPVAATAISALGGGLKNGAMASSVFGWSRIDLIPDLAIPGTTTFSSGTFAADVTFTLSY